MIKKSLLLLTVLMSLFLLTACDNTSNTKSESDSQKKTEVTTATAADSITIVDPKIRALPPGQKVTAMYMKLKNDSAKNHDLIKVESDISNMIELHTHTNENGVMKMGQVESIPVPANSTAEAKSGSYHVMIMGLQKDLELGQKVDFKLIFKDGSSESITAEVKKIMAHH